MEYLNKKPFTVPVGQRQADKCQGMHIWLDTKGRCVFCGEQVKTEPVAEKKPS